MTHPRALTDQTAITLERWYTEFECLGTVAAKCKELGISRVTFYDTIRRVRGQDTKATRKKLRDAPLDQLLSIKCEPCIGCGAEHSRRHNSGRPKRFCAECSAAKAAEYRKPYSEMTPQQKLKANARAMANVYQRRGNIIRQPCSKCGNPDAEKHHHDYSKPLDIEWLCRACHMLEHELAESLQTVEEHSETETT